MLCIPQMEFMSNHQNRFRIRANTKSRCLICNSSMIIYGKKCLLLNKFKYKINKMTHKVSNNRFIVVKRSHCKDINCLRKDCKVKKFALIEIS